MVARFGEYMNLPTRAAAISATQILTHKAALYLDVSPDEFEMLEPRLHLGKPILQIADALINGSGLCRRLAEPASADGLPLIVTLLHEILEENNNWPIVDFLKKRSSNSMQNRVLQVHTTLWQPSISRLVGLAFRYGLFTGDGYARIRMRPERRRLEPAGNERLARKSV